MRQCSTCKKGSTMGGSRNKLRGKYNPTTHKRKYPNLQKIKLPNGKRALVCTRCIKKSAKKA